MMEARTLYDAAVEQTLPAVPPHQFWASFLTSFAVILVSEIGDKTFFIAVVLSMRRGAKATFCGAGCALVIMTCLSGYAGRLLPQFVDKQWNRIAVTILFAVFGLALLWEAQKIGPEGGNSETNAEPAELREIEMELARKRQAKATDALETGSLSPEPVTYASIISVGVHAKQLWSSSAAFRTGFVEAFVMTLCAELGDRSQISTLALGSSGNIFGVLIGGILAHLLCSLIAVVGGKVMVKRLSERCINYAGAVTFLSFAVIVFFSPA